MHSDRKALNRTGQAESDLGYYRWRVVLAACLGVIAGFGSLFVYTLAVFVKPLSAEFHWNRESFSLGFSLATITLGLISPLNAGQWIVSKRDCRIRFVAADRSSALTPQSRRAPDR